MVNIIAVLAFPVLIAAPSHHPATLSAPIDSADMTLVVVQNDRKVPVTVYVQNEFGEDKLGVVAPFDTVTLALDAHLLARGEVQFFVQPAGDFEESSEPLELHRGERIGLVVPRR